MRGSKSRFSLYTIAILAMVFAGCGDSGGGSDNEGGAGGGTAGTGGGTAGSGGGDGVKADDPEQHDAEAAEQHEEKEDRGYDYVIAIMASSRPAYLSLLLEALDRCGTHKPRSFLFLGFVCASARCT